MLPDHEIYSWIRPSILSPSLEVVEMQSELTFPRIQSVLWATGCLWNVNLSSSFTNIFSDLSSGFHACFNCFSRLTGGMSRSMSSLAGRWRSCDRIASSLVSPTCAADRWWWKLWWELLESRDGIVFNPFESFWPMLSSSPEKRVGGNCEPMERADSRCRRPSDCASIRLMRFCGWKKRGRRDERFVVWPAATVGLGADTDRGRFLGGSR